MVTAPLSGVPCWVSPDLDLWKGTWVDKPGQNSDKTSPYATTPCKCRGADFLSFLTPSRLSEVEVAPQIYQNMAEGFSLQERVSSIEFS